MALARARARKRARPENRAKENAKRDYKLEYRRDQKKRIPYRSNLQKIARKRKIYGKTPKGMELGHQADGSIRLEDKTQNRRKGAKNAAAARVRNNLARANARRKYRMS